MKKRNIVIAILLILIIAVIISIIIYNNSQNVNNSEANNNNQQGFDEVQVIQEGNIFLAKVIKNEQNKIIVVPNSDELIYQSFKIINVLLNDNSLIINKDSSTATKDNILEGKTIKIEFDGKILSTNPTNIIAKTIEIQ